jgi:hypothetical protein
VAAPDRPAELPRRPKGHRPYYFDDPALDQLYAAHLALATELSVALDRLDALERVLERNAGLARAEVEEFRPDEAAAAERAERRAALVERLLRPFVDYRESLFARAKESRDHGTVDTDEPLGPKGPAGS